MRNRILLIILLLLAGQALCACQRQNKNQGHHFDKVEFSGSDISAEGRTLPEFILPNIRDGREIKRDSFVGRVVLVDVLSPFCPLCRKEMGDLQKIQDDFPATGFAVLGMMNEEDDQSEMKLLMEEGKYSYPMVVADQPLKKAFGNIIDVPVAFLVDRQGLILKKYIAHLDFQVVRKDIERLLALEK
jgi:thiol-disulfide isomerase/thioredoxin